MSGTRDRGGRGWSGADERKIDVVGGAGLGKKKMKTGRGLFGFGGEGRGFVWLRVLALDFLVEGEEDGGKKRF